MENLQKQNDIEIGGYSLTSSSWRGEEASIIAPDPKLYDWKKTGRRGQQGEYGGGEFGNAPCLDSPWSKKYYANLKKVYSETGMTVYENDGAYPGDLCASKNHFHKSVYSSQWKQWKNYTEHIQWNLANNIMMTYPDFYHLAGTHKASGGYREKNYSLPRSEHQIIARQAMHISFKHKPAPFSWFHVPIANYQGGGAEARYSPLSENFEDYEKMLFMHLATGFQGHFRGSTLFDTDKVKDMVIKWVNWRNRYWDIVNSDMISILPPNGRDIDAMLHVNPELKEKGLLLLFNPLKRKVTRKIKLPMYYTGLKKSVKVYERNSKTSKTYQIDRAYNVMLPIEVAPESFTWYFLK